jgi:hypothetical protein
MKLELASIEKTGHFQVNKADLSLLVSLRQYLVVVIISGAL